MITYGNMPEMLLAGEDVQGEAVFDAASKSVCTGCEVSDVATAQKLYLAERDLLFELAHRIRRSVSHAGKEGALGLGEVRFRIGWYA